MAPLDFGVVHVTDDDRAYRGSRFREVRDAVFANPYQQVWGRDGEPPLPFDEPKLSHMLRGAFGRAYPLRQAAERTVDTGADLRWGPDRRGFRRIVHPYGVCLSGRWKIDADSGYSGYFRKGSQALVVARYSTAGLIRRGQTRAQALAGKLFPTTDADHAEPLPTANFFTLDDVGGTRTDHVNDVAFVNAPDVTPWRHPAAIPILAVADVVFTMVDRESTIRQLYPIAELGEEPGTPTRAPQFMRLTLDAGQPRIAGEGLDARDEILAQIYDRGDPAPRRELVVDIDITDDGETFGMLGYKKRTFRNWRRIGRMVFDSAVASYNGDHVLHFGHPPWRADRDNAATADRGPH